VAATPDHELRDAERIVAHARAIERVPALIVVVVAGQD
jgi:hypothetical protein